MDHRRGHLRSVGGVWRLAGSIIVDTAAKLCATIAVPGEVIRLRPEHVSPWTTPAISTSRNTAGRLIIVDKVAKLVATVAFPEQSVTRPCSSTTSGASSSRRRYRSTTRRPTARSIRWRTPSTGRTELRLRPCRRSRACGAPTAGRSIAPLTGWSRPSGQDGGHRQPDRQMREARQVGGRAAPRSMHRHDQVADDHHGEVGRRIVGALVA